MEISEARDVLGRTPGVLRALLDGLPDPWIRRTDGPGTWSAYDIVGHLRIGDLTDWLPRARLILTHGTDRVFEPFDREAMLREEPTELSTLLDDFTRRREANLAELSTMDIDLDRRGRHPEFGEVTLGQLLATWVAHDLTHLAQIGEVLARHYRLDVGPWRAYLPALDRVAEAE